MAQDKLKRFKIMRWRQGRRSSNVEDRRGRRMSRGVKAGGGIAIVAALAALFLGNDMGPLINLISGGSQSQQQTIPKSPEDDTAADFVSVILADTEDVWGPIFKQNGGQYQPPKLVLFNGQVRSACGVNSAQAGPFYCPGDRQAYLDLSFLNELQRLGAKGDFAVAYVIAHEIGHHVQNLTGTMDKLRHVQMQSNKTQGNRLQVMAELQADCYAGVWAHHAHKQRQILESGDIEEGINAAAAIGDDALTKGRVHPDSFTHGTSRQRMEWLQRGLKSGDINSCDTFTAMGAG